MKKKPTSFGSYRGYYTDIAIGSSDDTYIPDWDFLDSVSGEPKNILNDNPKVNDIINVLKECPGYEGYKGGFYRMNYNGPLWYSEWGESNGQIVSGIKIINGFVVLEISNFDYPNEWANYFNK
jgi:hypothetical protein